MPHGIYPELDCGYSVYRRYMPRTLIGKRINCFSLIDPGVLFLYVSGRGSGTETAKLGANRPSGAMDLRAESEGDQRLMATVLARLAAWIRGASAESWICFSRQFGVIDSFRSPGPGGRCKS